MALADSASARSLSVIESVRWYEITPSWKSRCAADIARSAPNPSLRLASCCSVDVVNGGDGRWGVGFSSSAATRHGRAPRSDVASAPALDPSSNRAVFEVSVPVVASKSRPEATRWSPTRVSVAVNVDVPVVSAASRSQ